MVRKPERILIWGGGGHGKVVADLARACGYEVAGYVDGDRTKLGQVVEPGGATVLYREDHFVGYVAGVLPPDEVDAVALAIGRNATRLQRLRAVSAIELPPLLHPSAEISPSAEIGRGTVVMPRAVVNAAARIGEAVIVNTAAVVEHDCVVSDGAHLSPGAILAGGVRVGERSWIGAGAVVIEGIAIGADVTVGAGAVVIRDIPDGVTVAGVPARPIDAKV